MRGSLPGRDGSPTLRPSPRPSADPEVSRLFCSEPQGEPSGFIDPPRSYCSWGNSIKILRYHYRILNARVRLLMRRSCRLSSSHQQTPRAPDSSIVDTPVAPGVRDGCALFCRGSESEVEKVNKDPEVRQAAAHDRAGEGSLPGLCASCVDQLDAIGSEIAPEPAAGDQSPEGPGTVQACRAGARPPRADSSGPASEGGQNRRKTEFSAANVRGAEEHPTDHNQAGTSPVG